MDFALLQDRPILGPRMAVPLRFFFKSIIIIIIIIIIILLFFFFRAFLSKKALFEKMLEKNEEKNDKN